MTQFKRRMFELIAELPDINRGRRLRLLSPLRQAPLTCWEPLGDDALEETLHAAMRAAAHELLDEYCCHVAGALARCDSPEVKALVGALAAYLIASRVSVQFREGEKLAGVWFDCPEIAVIEPAAKVDGRRVELVVERQNAARSVRRCAGVTIGEQTRLANVISVEEWNWITLTPAAVRENPFHCAAEVWRRLGT
jgi:hypothetical protein